MKKGSGIKILKSCGGTAMSKTKDLMKRKRKRGSRCLKTIKSAAF